MSFLNRGQLKLMKIRQGMSIIQCWPLQIYKSTTLPHNLYLTWLLITCRIVVISNLRWLVLLMVLPLTGSTANMGRVGRSTKSSIELFIDEDVISSFICDKKSRTQSSTNISRSSGENWHVIREFYFPSRCVVYFPILLCRCQRTFVCYILSLRQLSISYSNHDNVISRFRVPTKDDNSIPYRWTAPNWN